jgi:hypothetical protein
MDSTRFEEVPCDLCGSAEHRVLIRPTVREFDPAKVISAAGGIMGTQQVVRCASCGLAYVTPRVISQMVVTSYKAAQDTTYVEGGAGRAITFAKARAKLGWKPHVTFKELARLMTEHDLDLAEREAHAATFTARKLNSNT